MVYVVLHLSSIQQAITMEKSKMSFVICEKQYELSEYDQAIKDNFERESEEFSFLIEFPYTMKLTNNWQLEKFASIPVYIIYKGKRISIHDFIEQNREFSNSLPLVSDINSLEIKHEMSLIFTHIIKQNDYHAVIYETFRIFQDLEFMIATARWALIQAHKVLHFRSGLVWKNGQEQLWTRVTWLNNAIVLYDSCFDKLIQSVWIGIEGYNAKQNLNRTSLCSIDGLDSIYKACWHRDKMEFSKISSPFRELIISFFTSEITKKVADYAQSIKHRGGMRYLDLFPYGQIFEKTDDKSYCSYRTRNQVDIDEVVEIVKNYHIMLCKNTSKVYTLLMEEFKKHGYLSDEKIIL